ncbi:hypothetical protein SLA2020_513710 [Shorea laevis]
MGLKGFVEGSLGRIAFVIAGCSIYPLDLIKVHMQLQGETVSVQSPQHPFRLAYTINPTSATMIHSNSLRLRR